MHLFLKKGMEERYLLLKRKKGLFSGKKMDDLWKLLKMDNASKKSKEFISIVCFKNTVFPRTNTKRIHIHKWLNVFIVLQWNNVWILSTLEIIDIHFCLLIIPWKKKTFLFSAFLIKSFKILLCVNIIFLFLQKLGQGLMEQQKLMAKHLIEEERFSLVSLTLN